MFSLSRFGAAATAIALSLAATAAQADTVVSWSGIAGAILDANVAAGIQFTNGANNPRGLSTTPLTNDIDNIQSGTFAWTTNGGQAMVNLTTGAVSFSFKALNINGTPFSGTAGPITKVVGTLVCNASPTNPNPIAVDTMPVTLTEAGDATFDGSLMNNAIPSLCDNPLFLVRINVPAGAAGRWIATGTGRTIARTQSGR